MIQYGEWKINADITATRELYSSFEMPKDKFAKNFRAYCDMLSAEEREFFDNFGIDRNFFRNSLQSGKNQFLYFWLHPNIDICRRIFNSGTSSRGDTGKRNVLHYDDLRNVYMG